MAIDFGGIQNPVGHFAGRRVIVSRTYGRSDVGQANQAHFADFRLHALRDLCRPRDIEAAHAIGWRLWSRRTRRGLAFRGAYCSYGSNAADCHGYFPFLSDLTYVSAIGAVS